MTVKNENEVAVTPTPIDGSHQNGNNVMISASNSTTNGSTTVEQPKLSIERTLSISEQATASSTGRCKPPFFLKWLEYPFRVKNIQTHQYLEEATGHAMDVTARGPINQTGSFIGSAMLRMAAIEAGGPSEKIYGIQASSYLSVGSLIVGVIAGVTMPLVGALVDHTDHRKIMGWVSAIIITISVGCQMMISQETWFAVFILEIIGGYFLIMHQVCTMAYLPDLSHDLVEMGYYTSRFMMNQYFVQGLYTAIVILVSQLAYTGPTGNLQTARLAAGMAMGIGIIFFGYSWTFLFRRRPKLREIPPGDNIFNTGFRRLFHTSKVIMKRNTEYRALKWFMISLLFSPEAGAGVILAIAVTFLTFFVKMDVKEIAIVSIAMLFSNLPGAFISMKMCRWVNPLNSFRCAEIMFAITNALLAGTVTGSTQRDKNLVYLYGALIGVAFGWMFPSQRTLAVALIPKGQETEIMGLISFFGQIVGWLPVFVFTAMNNSGVSMRWGVASISFFLLLSFICTLFCGSFDEAVEQVAHTSEAYLQEYKRKSERLRENSFVDSEKGVGDSKTSVVSFTEKATAPSAPLEEVSESNEPDEEFLRLSGMSK